ncbi:MAG: cyclic peptide export ABC transporter [Candidatus Aminicenantes bacterium]|nr:cyclic peptide export ABC transporter [Candidatus Aminicenantes bacterium]NIM85047.1 cyclic peptide export ABC transporter [Candidatus Aminicenantes bacterium]NIN24561.1 cyclic peptide export ABC transporter [Candidatus Aminicenantes bacterium]NIN48325.1 cyclic peptide export ABC transporter [Candidatus Aminicenantes bacterium]NIN91228.1 cyclic peptide export ABC transporter [Candidatus Aminicenantes bacterium]
MREKNIYLTIMAVVLLITIIIFALPLKVNADDDTENVGAGTFPTPEKIEEQVKKIMEEGKIPGASIVLIKGNEHVVIKSFGYADLERQIPVTPKTLFEIGSCSKSFTALAVLQLVKDGLVKLDDPVSKYFPGFKGTFNGEEYDITINQLLHHVSGIRWETFGKIPQGSSRDALRNVVEMVSGTKLIQIPGRVFFYSNTNFDIAGAVIEEASGMSYEDYMATKVFRPLGMNHTFIGTSSGGERDGVPMALGYKISFGKPQPFESPVFRGNFPAGYVVSNANEMATWLKAQLGLVETDMKSLIESSHQPNPSMQGAMRIIPELYSLGWQVKPGDDPLISHGGANPNFTAYVGLRPKDKLGVAVMANSNSNGAAFLGNRLMQLIERKISEEELAEYEYQALYFDSQFSTASYGLGALVFIIFAIFLYIIVDTLRGVRRFEAFNLKKLFHLGVALLATFPVLLGIYFFPDALAGFTWESALAWAPGSFQTTLVLLISFLAGINVLFLLSLILPYKDQTSFRNKYIRPLPMILFLSFVSGIAGSAAVVLISISFFTQLQLIYLLYFLGMSIFISVLGQKIVQTKMITITNNIVYELRMKLINKIFGTRYQKFEKIDSGRVYSTLNNDTEAIANSASLLVGTVTNFITALAAFVYLSAISFLATLATLLFAVLLGVFYIIVGKKSRVLMEKMRDTQNVFMKLIEGLVQGFREISLHFNKKVEYETDVDKSCDEYRRTRVSAFVKFVNANLVSSSMILVLLSGICISFPRLFPEMSKPRLISFIMVLLYMIGPVTSIMASFPNFIRIKVSWDRIQKFIAEIPAIEGVDDYKEIKAVSRKGKTVDSIEAQELYFQYPGEADREGFALGPIDLKVNKGEILFLVGGNGSGKTTLAMLLTGLYLPEKGTVKINGKEIKGDDYLGEYFSAVFGKFHLFQKLYNVDMEAKRDEIEQHLETLDLRGKVELKDGSFSTIDLSGGQRKRLALLQCYLEDCPIYIFDEVAADQDPEFRRFFYRDLLQRMKEQGKIVIAVTHDDHYFDVADKIIKLDMGKIDDKVLVAGSITGVLQAAQSEDAT